jgi:hypothetical protein
MFIDQLMANIRSWLLGVLSLDFVVLYAIFYSFSDDTLIAHIDDFDEVLYRSIAAAF